MPEELLASFAVKRLSVLDEHGNVDETLMPSLSEAEISRIYEAMVLARTFDERALALQREGRLGTYPPILGQEAAQVGSALALSPADWVFPSFREMGVHLTLGYPIPQLFQYWAGDERGQRAPDLLNIFPFCVSVGTHIPHAVGAAMAARYRRDPVVAVAYFGDGATSKGDFHEGFNMAGVFRLPVVYISVEGVFVAVSIAYGFDGVQVDGNDVFAVYRATLEALDKARSGGGPSFIECLTYRMADHTTSDDAARYRSPDEVAAWRDRDPILRLERYMAKRGLWSEENGKEARSRMTAAIDEAVQAMEAVPPPVVAEMFEHTCATLSPRQAGQLKEL